MMDEAGPPGGGPPAPGPAPAVHARFAAAFPWFDHSRWAWSYDPKESRPSHWYAIAKARPVVGVCVALPGQQLVQAALRERDRSDLGSAKGAAARCCQPTDTLSDGSRGASLRPVERLCPRAVVLATRTLLSRVLRSEAGFPKGVQPPLVARWIGARKPPTRRLLSVMKFNSRVGC